VTHAYHKGATGRQPSQSLSQTYLLHPHPRAQQAHSTASKSAPEPRDTPSAEAEAEAAAKAEAHATLPSFPGAAGPPPEIPSMDQDAPERPSETPDGRRLVPPRELPVRGGSASMTVVDEGVTQEVRHNPGAQSGS
jgi:hypothetical protein